MSLSQPSPPDANATAQTQTMYNQAAAGQNQLLNEVNQNTPYGSLDYSASMSPLGIPITTASQNLSPQQQQLLDQYQGTQGQLGSEASSLAGNTAGMYSSAPDFTSASSPLVQQQMAAFNSYMAPTYAMQQSNLNSQLQNQGIGQGSEAWTNAQRGQAQSQDQAAQSALMNFEPQAFNQAVQTYNQPLQTLAGLFGASAPQGVQQPFVTTPQTQMQPANYSGLTEQNYQQQNQIYGNTMSGLFGLGSAAIKGGLFGGGGAAGATASAG